MDFIRLTERKGNAKVNINIKKIETIKDLRTDKEFAKASECNRYTILHVGGVRYEVKETEKEIFRQITMDRLDYRRDIWD
jgi:hypothetical protein